MRCNGPHFFIYDLEMEFFSNGKSMVPAFACKRSVFWLLAFVFCLGLGVSRLQNLLLLLSLLKQVKLRPLGGEAAAES